ncbi:MAG TPA: metalloregulator ArsR/SmtB family transcription factor [Candidatus Limnocylindria bacterium]|nr:metalloregulator ArsR/SmtB family transcription factor [Candidatus Limnocylindria bacterium]
MIKNAYDMTLPTRTGGARAERDLRDLRIFYKALGDETRLRIIGLLAEGGPMPVHALSAGVGLSQPLISWHLRILRLARLIDTQRQGRAVICRLRLAAFEELHEAEARLIGGTAGVRSAGPAAAGHGEVPDVG